VYKNGDSKSDEMALQIKMVADPCFGFISNIEICDEYAKSTSK